MPAAAPKPELETTENFLASALRQFQLIGAFSACLGAGDSKDFQTRIRAQFLSLQLALSGAQVSAPHRAWIPETPVIYNPSSWHTERLCGYTGRDFTISAQDLLRSYMEFWLLTMNNSSQAADHAVKCLLWHFENHDRDLDGTLTFFLDLSRAGFVCSVNLMLDVFLGFITLYARDADLSFLRGASLHDRDTINRELSRTRRSLADKRMSIERLHVAVDWFIDHTLGLVAEAKNAQSIDEWLIRLAHLISPARVVASFLTQAEELELSLFQRATVSQVEEIFADLQAEFGAFRMLSEYDLPIAWDLTTANSVGREYRAHFPREEWLRRLTADRLVMPDAVAQTLQQDAEPGDLKAPEEWRLASPVVAIPFCWALRKDAASVRRWDFTVEALKHERLNLGYDPLPDAPKLPPNAIVEDKTFAAARHHLIELELRDYSSRVAFPSSGTPLEADLLDARARYPWHSFFCRSLGIARGLQGDLLFAQREIRMAVLLDMTEPLNWSALARASELAGHAEDARLFGTIAAHVAEVTGGNR
jgi:hypothetical protein